MKPLFFRSDSSDSLVEVSAGVQVSEYLELLVF